MLIIAGIIWNGLILAQWVSLMQSVGKRTDSVRNRLLLIAVAMCMIAGTLLSIISLLSLGIMSPTVQFNANHAIPLAVWSFWVYWWARLTSVELALFGLYCTLLLIVSVDADLHWAVGLVLIGVCASGLGLLVLLPTYPTA